MTGSTVTDTAPQADQDRVTDSAATEWDVLHRLAAILEHDRTLKPTSYGCDCVNHAERKRLFSAAEKVVRGILAMRGADGN